MSTLRKRLSTELEEVVELVEKPLLFLASWNIEAVGARIIDEIIREKKFFESTQAGSQITLVKTQYYESDVGSSIDLIIEEIPNADEEIDYVTFFAMDMVYMVPYYRRFPFQVNAGLYVYRFPPLTLGNFLFFTLNPEAMKVFLDYVSRHEDELPRDLLLELENFLTALEAVGEVNDVPPYDLSDERYILVKIGYMPGKERRIRELTVEHLVDYDEDKEPTITVRFVSRSGRREYEFTSDIPTLAYIAPKLGLVDDVRYILDKLKAVSKQMYRGVVVLLSLQRLKEV